MDREFDYQGHRVCVRVREVFGQMPGFTTELWLASVTVLQEGADWSDVGIGMPFGDPDAAYMDGEARGKSFIDDVPASKGQ